MGKHSRCVVGICENDMRYPGMHKKQSNVHGYIIMHKLPKDRAARVAWISAMLKGKKQVLFCA